MILRVLVVESEPEDTLFLRDVLTELDGSREWTRWTHLEPLFASSWAEAAELLAVERIDIIILDLDLSDSKGKETFLHYQLHAPQIPVVLLVSEATGPSLAEDLLREGAQDFLIKTQVDCAPLARAIRNAIDRHRLLSATRATSMVDTLTGLLSRDAFLLLAERDRNLADRLKRRQIVILAVPDPLNAVETVADEQRRDLELVEAADHLRNMAGTADLVARVGLMHLAISILDSEREPAELIWARLHHAAEAKNLRLGAAVFDPQRPMALDQLLERAAQDLLPSAAAPGVV